MVEEVLAVKYIDKACNVKNPKLEDVATVHDILAPIDVNTGFRKFDINQPQICQLQIVFVKKSTYYFTFFIEPLILNALKRGDRTIWRAACDLVLAQDRACRRFWDKLEDVAQAFLLQLRNLVVALIKLDEGIEGFARNDIKDFAIVVFGNTKASDLRFQPFLLRARF